MSRSLIGQSPRMDDVRRLIGKASRSRLPVLILGESGTGKEVIARAIYEAAPRGAFVPIDCGAIVGTLMESELFGHVKGAFTSANENKRGLVEQANGGTAFFDEIGDLPLEMQVKLLRLLQESQFRPVGATQWRDVDLRVISATHRDLKTFVEEGKFRQDLFYRLNVLTIKVPPLRERKEDIPSLVTYFLEAGGWEGSVNPEVLDALSFYDWPGNVRELKNCVDRMMATNSGGVLHLADLPSPVQNYLEGGRAHDLIPAPAKDYLPDFDLSRPANVVSIRENERRTICSALTASGGDRCKAARALGIGRTTLYRKMKSYGIA